MRTVNLEKPCSAGELTVSQLAIPKVKPGRAKIFGLNEIVQAHLLMESHSANGKIVVITGM